MDEYNEDYGRNHDDPGERAVSELEEVHHTLKEVLSTLKSRTGLSGFVWAVVIVILLDAWSGSTVDRWTDKVWCSLRYDAEFKNITVEKRPLDCDFLHVPMGGKGCWYKKRTIVQRAQQNTQDSPNTVIVYWEKKEY